MATDGDVIDVIAPNAIKLFYQRKNSISIFNADGTLNREALPALVLAAKSVNGALCNGCPKRIRWHLAFWIIAGIVSGGFLRFFLQDQH